MVAPAAKMKLGGKDIGMQKRPSMSKGARGEVMPGVTKGSKLSKEAPEVKKKNSSAYGPMEGASSHGKAKR